MVRYSEEVVDGVLRQLADEGNVVILWTADDIYHVLHDPFTNLKLTAEQEEQVVKRVQGSHQWLSLAEVYDDDWESIEEAVQEAIEELGFEE